MSTTSASSQFSQEGYSSKMPAGKPYGEFINFVAIKENQLITGPLPTTNYGKSAYQGDT